MWKRSNYFQEDKVLEDEELFILAMAHSMRYATEMRDLVGDQFAVLFFVFEEGVYP